MVRRDAARVVPRPIQRYQTVDEFRWHQTELGNDYSVEESMDFGKKHPLPIGAADLSVRSRKM